VNSVRILTAREKIVRASKKRKAAGKKKIRLVYGAFRAKGTEDDGAKRIMQDKVRSKKREEQPGQMSARRQSARGGQKEKKKVKKKKPGSRQFFHSPWGEGVLLEPTRRKSMPRRLNSAAPKKPTDPCLVEDIRGRRKRGRGRADKILLLRFKGGHGESPIKL